MTDMSLVKKYPVALVAWLASLVCLTAMALAAAASNQPDAPEPPEISPNAIEDVSQGMAIVVPNVPEGDIVYFQVLQDCNGDFSPELQPLAGCKSPLYSWVSAKAVRDRHSRSNVNDKLDFKIAERKSAFPRNKLLWLRAASSETAVGASFAIFVLAPDKDPCALFQLLRDIWRRPQNSCRVGLLQALLKYRGTGARETPTLFEVRRIATDGNPAEARPVRGTLGASGVAWMDGNTLLVTVGVAGEFAATSGPEARLTKADLPLQGLWKIPLTGGEPQLIWAEKEGSARQVAAPLALPGGAVAFVEQSPGDESIEGEKPASFLAVIENGRTEPSIRVPISYKIHQLLGSDSDGRSVVALTLGSAANAPSFLKISLADESVVNLGFHPAIYRSVFQSPNAEEAVIAFEDNSGQNGWELALVDGRGTLVKDLMRRPEDDLMPTWHPDGKEVAYLAEIPGERSPEP